MNTTRTLQLRNSDLFRELAETVTNSPRPERIGVFYGPSGAGKTTSAIQTANEMNAIYLRIGASWTSKKFVEKLASDLQVLPRRTVADTVESIIERLQGTSALMLLDEADFASEKKFLEIIREIHDATQTPVILIGEENLPTKLEAFERFHNRVVKFQGAAPATFEDAKKIIELNFPNTKFSDDLISLVLTKSQNILRRVITNAENCVTHGNLNGLGELTPDNCKGVEFFTGHIKARSMAIFTQEALKHG